MGFEGEDNVTNPVTNAGHRAGRSRVISSIDDGGTERLAVDANVTNAVLETNLDYTNDEVTTANSSDGGTTRAITAGDTSGRTIVVGGGASGASLVGNPVLVAGQDESAATVRTLRTNSSGDLRVVGNTGNDNADSGSPIKFGGRATTSAITAVAHNDRVDAVFSTTGAQTVAGTASGVPTNIEVDSSGRTIAVGAAATGVAPAGSPVYIGGRGTDGTVRPVLIYPADNSVGVSGSTAHDAVDASPPLKVGGRARTTAISAVATDDRVDAIYTVTGAQTIAGTAAGVPTNVAVDSSGNLGTQGSVAHDAVDSGNPVKVGGRAVAHGATPTEVAAADRTDLLTNRQGVPFVMGGVPNVQTSQYISTGTITDDNLLPAIATGTKYVVTRVSVTLDEATTVGVGFRLGFGSTTVPAAPSTNADGVAGILLTHPGLVPGGGITIGDGSGILGVGGDGEELRVTVSDAPTSGAIHFTVTWYTVAS